MDHNDARKDNVISDQYKIGAYFYDFLVFFFQLFIGGVSSWRRTFIELIDPQKEDKILELCCGTGSVSLRIAKDINSQIHGVDLSKDQIKVAEFKARLFRRNVVFSVQDASATDLNKSSFNKIIISGALHEIKSKRRQSIYQEVKRLLTQQGHLYISEPDLPENWWGRESFEFMFGKWNREHETAYEIIGDGLKDELKEQGFIQLQSKLSNFRDIQQSGIHTCCCTINCFWV